MGFLRQEYRNGLPFLSPGELPDPGMEPTSSVLAGGFFTDKLPGKPRDIIFAEFQSCKWRSSRSLELLLLLDAN